MLRCKHDLAVGQCSECYPVNGTVKPKKIPEWTREHRIKVGVKLVCAHELRLDMETGGKLIVPVGAEGLIEDIDENHVQVHTEFDGGAYYTRHLRGDFTYFWKPIGAPPPARPREKRSMITDRHPDMPGKPGEGKKFIGYWAGSSDPDADEYEAKSILLPWPADCVDESWSPSERNTVVHYLKMAPKVEHWMGFSWCRCGCEGDEEEVDMGVSDQGDGVYIWPEGFAHYVEKHGVKPPQEFIDRVLQGVIHVPGV